MKKHLIEMDSKTIVFNPETYEIHICKNKDVVSELVDKSSQNEKYINQCTNCNTDLDIQAVNICMCETCNLACSYCFFHSGTFDKVGGKMITLETLIETYEKLSENSKSGLRSIGFYGGEPLMNFDVIRDFVYYVKAHSKHNVSFGVITNGTLLTKEMVDFFDENKFYVSISLDGTKKYNDMCRISKDGKSVFDTVMENLKLLKNRRVQCYEREF